MNYYKSRLGRKFEKQAKRQIFLSILGILILLFLVFKYGIISAATIVKLFININEKSYSKQIQQNNSDQIVMPPLLDTLDYATNSASINVSGKSVESEGKVYLFLNGVLKSETEVDKKGEFSFENVELSEGTNAIKAQIKTSDNKVSEFSKENNVIYIKKSPDLDISYPQDGTTFSKDSQDINISGKTNPNNRVTINGYWATMQQDGTFNYTLRLKDGDNSIVIEAKDIAGNKVTKELKVKYQH